MRKQIFILLFFNFIITDCFSQSWYPLGSGLVGSDQYDAVNTLCTDSVHNRLWTGGSFQIAGGDSIRDLAYWDGSNWFPMLYINALNDTVEYQYDAEVTCSIMFHGKYFFAAAPNPIYGFGRWRLYSYDADSFKLTGLATFNGSINALEIFNDTIYAAGEFSDYEPYGSNNPQINLNGIAKWNLTDFIPVGLGLDGGEFNAMCIHNGNLIAGGFFEFIDGTYCKNIAQWDGSQWFAIGNGIGILNDFAGHIKSLASYHGKLYAGGNDIEVGTGTDLMWSQGGSWTSVNSTFVYVSALKVFQDKLYAGTGTFYNILPPGPWYEVVCFNDTIWRLTGKGPRGGGSNPIHAFDSFNSNLYTGGEFIVVGDTPWINSTYAGFVARFDPTIIPPIYEYINAPLCFGSTYDFYGQTLFVPGTYIHTLIAQSGGDSIVTLNLTYVNPTQNITTVQICEGEEYNFNGYVFTHSITYNDTITNSGGCDSVITLLLTVLPFNPSINISNDILTASGGSVQWLDCNSNQIITGETDSIYIPASAGGYAAIITNGSCIDTTSCVFYNVVNELTDNSNGLNIYPNPASEQLIIDNGQLIIKEIEITDLTGRVMLKVKTEKSKDKNVIDVHEFDSGIYFLKAETKTGGVTVKKFIKQ